MIQRFPATFGIQDNLICVSGSVTFKGNEPAASGPPAGMEICRDGDEVYNSVIAVVTSITHFSKVVPDAAPPQYVALVKVRPDIGMIGFI